MRLRRLLLPAALLLGLLISPRGTSAEPERSSLLLLVERVAEAARSRAEEAGGGELEVLVRGGRGIDSRKAERVFGSRLATALAARGGPDAPRLRCRIELSLEAGAVWAVGLFEPEDLAFAVSVPVDRELEAVLGACPGRPGQGRWTAERLGTVPAGVLDLLLADLDGDGADDIVVLSRDGLRVLRFPLGAARPEALGAPIPFPRRLPWPRTVAGRLARQGTLILAATTAGHRFGFSASDGSVRATPGGDVTLAPFPGAADSRLLTAEFVGRGPSLRLVDAEAEQGLLPPRTAFRDLGTEPGPAGRTWWIDPSGALRSGEGEPIDQVGDRLVVADLDRDGRAELATSGPGSPGEPDRLVIRRVGGDGQGAVVVFEAAFSGSIAALAGGDLDFDGPLDLVVAEETGDDAVLWRIEAGR